MLSWLSSTLSLYDFSGYVGTSTTPDGAIQSCVALIRSAGYEVVGLPVNSNKNTFKYIHIKDYGYYSITKKESYSKSGNIYTAHPQYFSDKMNTNELVY